MLKQCGHFLKEAQYIIVRGKRVKVELPPKYRIPDNLTIEKMIDEIAKRYTQDPDFIAETKTQYDYYMVKIWNAQEYVSSMYIQITYFK